MRVEEDSGVDDGEEVVVHRVQGEHCLVPVGTSTRGSYPYPITRRGPAGPYVRMHFIYPGSFNSPAVHIRALMISSQVATPAHVRPSARSNTETPQDRRAYPTTMPVPQPTTLPRAHCDHDHPATASVRVHPLPSEDVLQYPAGSASCQTGQGIVGCKAEPPSNRAVS
jgi:hypothetical protein